MLQGAQEFTHAIPCAQPSQAYVGEPLTSSTVLHVLPPNMGFDHPLRVRCERFRWYYYVMCLNYEDYPFSGLERDEFDFDATYLALERNGKIIGFGRLVPALGTIGVLPMHNDYDSREIVGGIPLPTYEVSRLIVDCTLPRTLRTWVLNTLLEAVGLFLHPRVPIAMAVVEPGLHHLLQRKYSAEAFIQVGRETYAQKGEGDSAKVLVHVPLKVMVEEWWRKLVVSEFVRGHFKLQEYFGSIPKPSFNLREHREQNS